MIAPIATVGAPTDATGAMSTPFSVPNAPGFLGLELFCQGAALDPFGGFLGVVSLSDGLHLVIGR